METALYNQCESLKTSILLFATENTATNDLLHEIWLDHLFAENAVAQQLSNDLKPAASAYNKTQASAGNRNPVPEQIFQEMINEKTVESLNAIGQVQMILLQNERERVKDMEI